jgi:VanZ family protein
MRGGPSWYDRHATRAGLQSAFVGLALLIAVATLAPTSSLPQGVPGNDKLQHFGAFGALAFVGGLTWPAHVPWVIFGVVLYGGAIEVVQPQVGRSGEWSDWIADLLGALSGGSLAYGVARACKGAVRRKPGRDGPSSLN